MKMKITTFNIGLASTVLLSCISSTNGLPQWLEPHRRDADANLPHEYRAYNSPKVAHYSYGGYGPAPTITSSSSTKVEVSSVSSDAEGSLTSREGYPSCKSFPGIDLLQY